MTVSNITSRRKNNVRPQGETTFQNWMAFEEFVTIILISLGQMASGDNEFDQIPQEPKLELIKGTPRSKKNVLYP